MKYALLPALIFAAATVNAADQTNYNLSEALQNGDFSLNLSVGYFDRGFDDPDKKNAEAFTAGGIAKYESASFNNFKIGLAYFGSHSLGIIDRDKGKGTSYLQSDGDDIAFLGEAYIDFDNGTHQVKLGRQRLSTPLMGDHNIRLLPSTYGAAVYRNRTLANTVFELGYVERYSGFTSKLSDFEVPDAKWGDDGLAYIYITTRLGNVSLRGQFVDTLDDSGSRKNFRYLDAAMPLSFGEKSYIKAQYGGTAYQVGDTSKMFGLKTGTSFGSVDVALSYNAIRDGNFQAVESGPMYTDWQQGYGPYEPSDAYGVQVIFHPHAKSSIKLGYVDVDGKDGSRVDEYGEFNLDAKYNFTDVSSVRLRYSMKNQEHEDATGRYDRDDLRLYYYHTF
ncbi:MAG: hypothetical protein ACKE8G_02140 [Methylophagaceae bacterium]